MMRRITILVPIALSLGCGNSTPKPEVSFAEVAGTYHGYMEPSINPMEPVEQGVMKTVQLLKLTIKDDGTYQLSWDHPFKKNIKTPADTGTMIIEGKSLRFNSKSSFDPEKVIDQPYSLWPNLKLDPIAGGKYGYQFPCGHRMVLFKG